MRRIMVVAVLLAATAGCGGSTDPLGPGTEPAVVEVVEDVDYYYACGNEVLELADGRSFYPLVEQDAVDPDDYLGAGAVASTDLVLAAGHDVVLAVVAPGPGDDTGTLTIYDDGMAYWLSDSGIEAWLDDEVREYEWVC